MSWTCSRWCSSSVFLGLVLCKTLLHRLNCYHAKYFLKDSCVAFVRYGGVQMGYHLAAKLIEHYLHTQLTAFKIYVTILLGSIHSERYRLRLFPLMFSVIQCE